MPSTKPLERRPARRQRPWSATSRNAGYFLAGAHRVSRNVVVRQRLCPRGPAPRSLMPSHGRRAPCRPLGLGVDLSFCGQPVGDGIPAFEIAARSPQIGTLRNLSVPSFLFSLVGGRIAHRWIFHGGLAARQSSAYPRTNLHGKFTANLRWCDDLLRATRIKSRQTRSATERYTVASPTWLI
jgi:hypothetical protein